MPYLATFLAGIVTWNVFEKKTENKSESPVIKVITTSIIMYIGYRFLKKL